MNHPHTIMHSDEIDRIDEAFIRLGEMKKKADEIKKLKEIAENPELMEILKEIAKTQKL